MLYMLSGYAMLSSCTSQARLWCAVGPAKIALDYTKLPVAGASQARPGCPGCAVLLC
jgi:hypothetical protein